MTDMAAYTALGPDTTQMAAIKFARTTSTQIAFTDPASKDSAALATAASGITFGAVPATNIAAYAARARRSPREQRLACCSAFDAAKVLLDGSPRHGVAKGVVVLVTDGRSALAYAAPQPISNGRT